MKKEKLIARSIMQKIGKKKAYNKKYNAENREKINAKKWGRITPAVEKAKNELELRIRQMQEGSKTLENASSTSASVTHMSPEEKNDKELLNLYGDDIEEISLGDISTNADTGNDAGINLDVDRNSQIPKIIVLDNIHPIEQVIEEELEKLSKNHNENSTDLQQNDSSGSSQDIAVIGGLPSNSNMESNTTRKRKSDTHDENKRTAKGQKTGNKR